MTHKNVDPITENLPVNPTNENFPEYGLIYFKHLLGQYETLSEDKLIRPEAVKMNEIVVNYRKYPKNITWNDLYKFEILLIKILPPEKLRRKVWNLRARYREVAGIREYDAYLASKPPDLASEVDVDKYDDIVRADIDFLMSEIYVRYAMEPVRQSERKVLLNKLALAALIGIGLIFIFSISVYLLGKDKNASFPGSVFYVAMFSGAMGGLISMLHRFQSLTSDGDPINNISQMSHGQFGAPISAVTGAVSGLVLFMVFEAGLLSGSLFPALDETSSSTVASSDTTAETSDTTAETSDTTAETSDTTAETSDTTAETSDTTAETSDTTAETSDTTAETSDRPDASSEKEKKYRISFLDFFSRVGPKSFGDFAKLIVWCFIAGFAERFVPDTLSRFVSKRQTEREIGS